MFKAKKYNFILFTSHGLNYKALFLSYQLISVALHGSSIYLAVVNVPDLDDHIPGYNSSSFKEENSSKNNHLVWRGSHA